MEYLGPILPTTEEWAAKKAVFAAKELAINTNLPSWAQVETACDDITTLAEAKAFLKKLSRVVYWLAKNSEI